MTVFSPEAGLQGGVAAALGAIPGTGPTAHPPAGAGPIVESLFPLILQEQRQGRNAFPGCDSTTMPGRQPSCRPSSSGILPSFALGTTRKSEVNFTRLADGQVRLIWYIFQSREMRRTGSHLFQGQCCRPGMGKLNTGSRIRRDCRGNNIRGPSVFSNCWQLFSCRSS